MKMTQVTHLTALDEMRQRNQTWNLLCQQYQHKNTRNTPGATFTARTQWTWTSSLLQAAPVDLMPFMSAMSEKVFNGEE